MAVVVNKNKVEMSPQPIWQRSIGRKSEVAGWNRGRACLSLRFQRRKGTLEHLLKVSESELKSLTAARKNSLKVVATDAEVLDLVQSTPGAVGLVDVNSINGSINVVKVDGKLPTEAGYLPH